jgi:hypothetical protein
MPSINLPLVKFERDAGGFICPKCKTKFATHPEFVHHFSTKHAPSVGVRHRGPQVTPAPPPKSAGGDQVTCPICQRKILGSDYAEHGKVHSGGLTVSQFNQNGEPR